MAKVPARSTADAMRQVEAESDDSAAGEVRRRYTDVNPPRDGGKVDQRSVRVVDTLDGWSRRERLPSRNHRHNAHKERGRQRAHTDAHLRRGDVTAKSFLKMVSGAPRDKFRAVWLVFFILGLGTLLPWNFFMTATAYFTGRLRESTNGTEGEEPQRGVLGAKFNNVMTLCAMLPLLIFTCLNSVLHSRIGEGVRVAGSLALILAIFLLTAVLVKVRLEPTAFYCVTVLSVVAINSFGAVLQGSLFGMAGALPAGYTAPVMSGQGLAGTFAALAMICAIASGSSLEESSFGYFISACVVILVSIMSYAMLPKLEFFQFYHQRKDGHDHDVNVNPNQPSGLCLRTLPLLGSAEGGSARRAGVSVTTVFKKIWVPAACVCGTFTVTIGTFPAIAADTKSTLARGGAWDVYLVPVSCFLLFNASDWAGRSLTAFCTWPGKDSALLPVLVACRAALVPALMLCNVQPRRHLPVVFRHDAFFAAFMLVFAFTNGYLASLAMCFGPKKVQPHEAETAGSVMAFFLSLGLASGAALSFALRALV
ncbi:equilibrative nucleoside transporter 1-like isoform X2 [Phycodurus eques]|nr:equilibrative nucleoside transporter 1-like isoform X2 [Phycodurus eques]XP_061535327.1 equilibrative nucleoside transporter 1-like isoform X2 [Phycodurus eques]